MSDRYLDEKRINQGEFYALILFSTAGAMVMAHAYDLINVFVGLEVLSVALYILCGFVKRDRRSEESAVKYFLLGAFASAFLVYGTALIYGAVGLAAQTNNLQVTSGSYTNFYAIAEVLRATQATGGPLVYSPLFVTGVALVIVGLGFKASIVPFHSYAPDVYEGAPTPVTAFMSAAAKIGAFAVMVRLFGVLLSGNGGEPFRFVLWFLALATMLVGNILAVRQTNIKRMLAYSSIAHAGYILVGVLASGYEIAAPAASQAILFYLFVYTFMNLGAFATVIWLGRGGGEYLDIRDYAGLGKTNPLAATVMSVFMLSLAGIPLTAGFLGKLYLFFAALKAGEQSLAALGLVISAIGVFYYLNVVVQMFFREPVHNFENTREGGAKWVAILSAVSTILFGVFPNPLLPREGLEPNLPRPTAETVRRTRATNSVAPQVSPALPTELPEGETANREGFVSPESGSPNAPSTSIGEATEAGEPSPVSPEGGAPTPEARVEGIVTPQTAPTVAAPEAEPTPVASPTAEPTP